MPRTSTFTRCSRAVQCRADHCEQPARQPFCLGVSAGEAGRVRRVGTRGAQSLCSPPRYTTSKPARVALRGGARTPRAWQPILIYSEGKYMRVKHAVYAATAQSWSCWLYPGMSQTFLLVCLSVPECVCAMQETVVYLYMHEHQHHISYDVLAWLRLCSLQAGLVDKSSVSAVLCV